MVLFCKKTVHNGTLSNITPGMGIQKIHSQITFSIACIHITFPIETERKYKALEINDTAGFVLQNKLEMSTITYMNVLIKT